MELSSKNMKIDRWKRIVLFSLSIETLQDFLLFVVTNLVKMIDEKDFTFEIFTKITCKWFTIRHSQIFSNSLSSVW